MFYQRHLKLIYIKLIKGNKRTAAINSKVGYVLSSPLCLKTYQNNGNSVLASHKMRIDPKVANRFESKK